MEKRDLHTHTVFSDGLNTPEEMVLAAIDKGMSQIGISDHSFIRFDPRDCLEENDIEGYKAEIFSLKEKYCGKIEVLCGIEQDYYTDIPALGYDYVIGSVHYIKAGDEYISIDESPLTLTDTAKRYYNGDIYSLCEEYYRTVSDVVSKTGADIIGHFDLISKFNEKNKFFDENSSRYIKAWRSAADILLKTGALFEINTGAVYKGYRSYPYPTDSITEYIKSRGGKMIFSSDSHRKEQLCFGFKGIE